MNAQKVSFSVTIGDVKELGPAMRQFSQMLLTEATDAEIDDAQILKCYDKACRLIQRAANEIETMVSRQLDPHTLWTDKQFDMVARAIGSDLGASVLAAKQVLTKGMSQMEAARLYKTEQPLVYNAMQRFRLARNEMLAAA